MGMMLAAALWGFAEATLFFIVPDVLLTGIAIRHGIAAACRAAIAAAFAAMAGGLVMYGWGLRDPDDARHMLDAIPAISPTMIESVGQALAHRDLAAMFRGAVSGVPYKVYAVEAGANGLPLPLFAAASVLARFFRFIFTATIAAAAGQILSRWLGRIGLGRLHAAFWVLFYVLYFAMMPN